MLRAWILLVLVGSALAAPPDELTVVVTGDGRADRREPRPCDKDGVNAEILRELVRATIREEAAAFVFTGDLVAGDPDPDVLKSQLRAWMGHVQPLLEKGVRVLPVRGNHEIGKRDARFDRRTEVYKQIVAAPCKVPDNGPEGEKLLTYSVTMGSALFIGLDQYTGEKVSVNTPWLTEQLAKSEALHVIPFAHAMAFTAGRHEDHMGGGERGDVGRRDGFWNALVNAKVPWFFAGHDHLYDRMTVTPKAGGFAVVQVVAGTAGAPLYQDKDYFAGDDAWAAKQEAHQTGRYGYVLVRIAGEKATMTFKARAADGTYEAIDRWSYTR